MRYEFGPFRLEPAERRLLRDGQAVALTPKAFDTLCVLVARQGHAVSRDELMASVWPGTSVEDATLAQNILAIRKAIGAESIETVPKFGYRFVARVNAIGGDLAGAKIVLAVLPFENRSGDDEQEYFSDGLTDEMIAQLGRINPERLGVIARTSAMRYKRTTKGVDIIGRELGAAYILESSVRRSGDRLRVTSQLVRVSDQTPQWSETYDRGVGDMLSLQSEIARAIAAEIRVQLTPQEERRIARLPPIDAGAYEAYLKGRFFWNGRTRTGLEKSVSYFEQAIARQPQYAAAYAGLADTFLTQLDYNHLPPDEAFVAAGRAVTEALRLDDSLADPHASLGHLRFHEFKWREAEAAFARAIALNASYGTAHYYYANLLAALGRYEHALAEGERAIEMDPVSPNARQNQVFLLYIARRYEEALVQAFAALEIDPDYASVHYILGLLYERLGRYDEALSALESVNPRRERSGSTVAAAIAIVHARAGRREEAIAALQRLEALAATEYVPPYELALLNVALGRTDAAFAELQKACDRHASFAPYFGVDARLDDIRGDPRFRDVLARLGLPAPTGWLLS